MPELDKTGYHIKHPNGTVTFLGVLPGPRASELVERTIAIDEPTIMEKLSQVALPLQGRTDSIVGWGTLSVAQRVSECHGQNWVSVLHTLPTGADPIEAAKVFLAGKRVGYNFEAFTNYQHIVIASGIDGHPAILKLSKEVLGATVSDVSGLYLVRNPKLLSQYSDFFKETLLLFLTQGIAVDVQGHARSHPLSRKLEGLGILPFNSDNLMVDFQGNKLVLIDTDITRTFRFKGASLGLKAQAVGRVVEPILNIALAETLLVLNTLRNKLFHTPTSSTAKDAEGYNEFLAGFADAIDLLEESGLDYRVLGSFAIAGQIQSHGQEYFLTPKRNGREIRDIDVLVLDDDPKILDWIQAQVTERRGSNSFYPEVSLHTVLDLATHQEEAEELEPHRLMPAVLARTAKDCQGNYYFVFKDIAQIFPNEYLDPIPSSYEGINFPTVPEGVLAGYSLARYGALRSKDVDKITQLLQASGARIPPEFLDFTRAVRSGYRDLYRKALIKDLMYYFSGGILPGAISQPIRRLIR